MFIENEFNLTNTDKVYIIDSHSFLFFLLFLAPDGVADTSKPPLPALFTGSSEARLLPDWLAEMMGSMKFLTN